MKKIPTLFARDPVDRRYVLPEVTPGCEWVLDGEGVATRKYDGTCVLIDQDGILWKRREVKANGTPPEGFWQADHDETTGKTVGWVRCEDTNADRYQREAFLAHVAEHGGAVPGTYELCGPKINGNPESYPDHVLIAHADAEVLWPFTHYSDPQEAFDALQEALRDFPHEGVVWHHPDGRMVKLKRRDFPPPRPTEENR